MSLSECMWVLSALLFTVPVETLKYWRLQKRGGPASAKFGRHVRYRLTDVEAWEEAQVGGS